ncbi:DUF4365 domain-containing protein [Coleofasciculus sp. E1-EBD-02]|uniref:DUF4365 domain-containing protein n=1 Tax=Coleofasciculus sp. E1-EBD-02 TaxID=3068481 RepID=UPI0032FFAB1F
MHSGAIRVEYADKGVEGLIRVNINIQKEEFSYAYLYAVISAAVYSFQKSSRPLDVGGIDVSITGTTSDDSLYEPQLDLQVKSTSIAFLSDNVIRYPLKLKNHNELRKERTVAPRILVLVLIPENLEEWIQQSETELCMRHCAYWKSLRGQPQTLNTESVGNSG